MKEYILLADIIIGFISACCLDSDSWLPLISLFISLIVFIVIGLKEGFFRREAADE